MTDEEVERWDAMLTRNGTNRFERQFAAGRCQRAGPDVALLLHRCGVPHEPVSPMSQPPLGKLVPPAIA